MTDLEPITTPEAYEAVRGMALDYEARVLELQSELDRKSAEFDIARTEKLARTTEIRDNLRATLWALEAQCHDYELNELRFSEQADEPKGSWAAEVFSLRDLIQAAGLNPMYEQYLQANQVGLNKLARKMKRTMYVPGVVATRKEKP